MRWQGAVNTKPEENRPLLPVQYLVRVCSLLCTAVGMSEECQKVKMGWRECELVRSVEEATEGVEATLFWGGILAMALSGVRIDRCYRSPGQGQGRLGKIGQGMLFIK